MWIMELDTALNVLRFSGLWPVKEKKSWSSKLVRARAAFSQTVFFIIMILIIINWWMVEVYTSDDIYINVARQLIHYFKGVHTTHVLLKEKEISPSAFCGIILWQCELFVFLCEIAKYFFLSLIHSFNK